MRTLDLRGALRRRWYVLLVGILVTGALAVAALLKIGPAHEIRSSDLLLPPDVSVVAPESREPANPFLRLDGIDPALSVLVTKLMADDFSASMLEGAPDTDYTVAEDPLSQAPIVVIAVTGKDSAEASMVLDRVSEEMPRVLDNLQADAGITRSARITLVPLVRDEKPSKVIGGLLRIEILLIGVGLVGTLLLAGLWDALARSRAAARAGVGEDAGHAPPALLDPASEDARTGDRPRTTVMSKSARRRAARSRNLRSTAGESPGEDGPTAPDDQVDAGVRV